VSTFGLLDLLLVAVVLFVVFVGPFVAIRAVAIDRRRNEYASIAPPIADPDGTRYVPPSFGWPTRIVLYGFSAVSLAVGLLLLESADERVRLAAGVFLVVTLVSFFAVAAVDILRTRATRAALRRLTEELEASGELGTGQDAR
jgi:hypothetical protein